MLLPITPHENELPSDVRAMRFIVAPQEADIPKGASFRPSSATPESTPPLTRYFEDTHIYSKEIAAKISFLAGLFDSSADKLEIGLIHEAKRYRIEASETGRSVEIGVSVRLSVASNTEKIETKVTIPNLAAVAQLNRANVRVAISVIGFSGPLGHLLVSPAKLDVESYSQFMSAFERVKQHVFGNDGLPFIAPDVLAYDPLDA